MYLLNSSIWYLKSIINNLKVLHQATRMRDQQKLREQPPTSSNDQHVYSFWIDYLSGAINSNLTLTLTEE